MTTPGWRDRLRREHRGELESWRREREAREVIGDEDFDHLRRLNELEALRAYDPRASLAEELTVRLQSGDLTTGALSFALADALFKPLKDAVSSLADGDVDLEIVGISSGSTVLHVRPAIAPAPEVMDGARVDSSRADHAVRSLLGGVRALENGESFGRWRKQLREFARLGAVLDRFETQMDLVWWAANGDAPRAKFAETGRSRVSELMETKPDETRRVISGRVTELRESGIAKVKAGVARNSAAFEIRFEQSALVDLHLELGNAVDFLVREVRRRDGTGEVQSTEWYFIGPAPSPDATFDELTEDR